MGAARGCFQANEPGRPFTVCVLAAWIRVLRIQAAECGALCGYIHLDKFIQGRPHSGPLLAQERWMKTKTPASWAGVGEA